MCVTHARCPLLVDAHRGGGEAHRVRRPGHAPPDERVHLPARVPGAEPVREPRDLAVANPQRALEPARAGDLQEEMAEPHRGRAEGDEDDDGQDHGAHGHDSTWARTVRSRADGWSPQYGAGGRAVGTGRVIQVRGRGRAVVVVVGVLAALAGCKAATGFKAIDASYTGVRIAADGTASSARGRRGGRRRAAGGGRPRRAPGNSGWQRGPASFPTGEPPAEELARSARTWAGPGKPDDVRQQGIVARVETNRRRPDARPDRDEERVVSGRRG